MNSLWRIPDISDFKTPILLFKEQASALNEVTGGALIGQVSSSPGSSSELLVSLYITVPALNKYSFHVCTYVQPLTIYPGRLHVPITQTFVDIVSPEDFANALARLLSSDELAKVVAGLLAQARDAIAT